MFKPENYHHRADDQTSQQIPTFFAPSGHDEFYEVTASPNDNTYVHNIITSYTSTLP